MSFLFVKRRLSVFLFICIWLSYGTIHFHYHFVFTLQMGNGGEARKSSGPYLQHCLRTQQAWGASPSRGARLLCYMCFWDLYYITQFQLFLYCAGGGMVVELGSQVDLTYNTVYAHSRHGVLVRQEAPVCLAFLCAFDIIIIFTSMIILFLLCSRGNGGRAWKSSWSFFHKLSSNKSYIEEMSNKQTYIYFNGAQKSSRLIGMP